MCIKPPPPILKCVLNPPQITTTHALIGKYLSLKQEGVEPVDHADRFYYWLKFIGTPAGFRYVL
jgi:hypothetical protein